MRRIEPYCTRSYGLLILNTKNEVLLVQRKDSVEYIDLLRGRFHGDTSDLEFYMSRLTTEEIYRLRTIDFDTLWDQLWVNHSSKSFSAEYAKCKRAFHAMDFTRPTVAFYTEPEFVIPRGRRKSPYESPVVTAKRECFEETGIPQSAYTVDESQDYFEFYYGSNGVLYCTTYWIARLHQNHPDFLFDKCNTIQNSEVRAMGFYTFHAAVHKVRAYRVSMRSVLLEAAERVN